MIAKCPVPFPDLIKTPGYLFVIRVNSIWSVSWKLQPKLPQKKWINSLITACFKKDITTFWIRRGTKTWFCFCLATSERVIEDMIATRPLLKGKQKEKPNRTVILMTKLRFSWHTPRYLSTWRNDEAQCQSVFHIFLLSNICVAYQIFWTYWIVLYSCLVFWTSMWWFLSHYWVNIYIFAVKNKNKKQPFQTSF